MSWRAPIVSSSQARGVPVQGRTPVGRPSTARRTVLDSGSATISKRWSVPSGQRFQAEVVVDAVEHDDGRASHAFAPRPREVLGLPHCMLAPRGIVPHGKLLVGAIGGAVGVERGGSGAERDPGRGPIGIEPEGKPGGDL